MTRRAKLEQSAWPTRNPALLSAIQKKLGLTVDYDLIGADIGSKWWQQASCKDRDPNQFAAYDAEGKFSPVNVAVAKRACGSCAVRLECAVTAFQEDDRVGVRGGMTPLERIALRRTVENQVA